MQKVSGIIHLGGGSNRILGNKGYVNSHITMLRTGNQMKNNEGFANINLLGLGKYLLVTS